MDMVVRMNQIFTSISAFIHLCFSRPAINFALLQSELSGKTRSHILFINAVYTVWQWRFISGLCFVSVIDFPGLHRRIPDSETLIDDQFSIAGSKHPVGANALYTSIW